MRYRGKPFIRIIDQDDQGIFTAAGQMDHALLGDVVTWGGNVSGHARLMHDRGKIEQGRRAELLTPDT